MNLPHITATEAIRLFRTQRLSPVELLDAVVARTRETEPLVNSVTEQMLEAAYRAARESEKRYQDKTPRPLDGVPLMLKEEQPITGYLSEEGSLLEKGNVAEVTHPIVDRIITAGAVVHGRTTTPEFCCAPVTHTRLWGITRNPHNPEMTPGGSSGGSGAALASGSTVLATGSDIGGSIRIPASYCGVVGFKPPFARVPGLAPFNADTYCADGPMGRSVADVALLQNIIAGPWAGDPASLRPRVSVSGDVGTLNGVRIALSFDLGGYDPDPIVVTRTEQFALALENAGASVEEVDLPWTPGRVLDIAWKHFGGIMGPFIESIGRDSSAESLMPYTRAFINAASRAGSYAVGLVEESTFYRPLGNLFETFDALVCPTVTNTGMAADATCTDSADVFSQLMTLPFNIVGRVPVLAVPSGRAPNGVPTGVQIVGRTFDDPMVFRIGAAVEAELGLTTADDWWPDLSLSSTNTRNTPATEFRDDAQGSTATTSLAGRQ
ncbi:MULTISPECIES: amidase [Brevibacterium]|uniref:Amidase n=1 Tax=Brevibacterium casei TaxID=33889 RepID=A0A7T4DJ40_9MICO|nr:amidase [Brevibacterium casei]QQB13519.1 amidase [Brevibacterium casei]